MIKIIAGKYGSRNIKTLKGDNTRPTSNKVRGAIFSRVGPYYDGGDSLDLFAGSGAFSFEALSRGIKNAYLVDNNRDSINIIKENAKLLDVDVNIINKDYKIALNLLKDKKFKLIFLDPPYKLRVIDEIIKFVDVNNMLIEDGVIIVETEKNYQLNKNIGNISIDKEAIYGDSKISYYIRKV